MGDMHDSGVSEERFEALVRKIERRIPKAAMFYIGRTNSLIDRREEHKPGRDFDCMVRLDTFSSPRVCDGVEGALIRLFKQRYNRCDNIRLDGGGRWGAGPQHIYLMWRER